MKSFALLFPGQGTQYIKMCHYFINKYKIANEVFQEANDLLKYDLKKIIFEGKLEDIVPSEIAQPAIVATSYAMFKVYMNEIGIKPDYSAGHSLGEISAIIAAGGMKFSDGIIFAKNRGTIMDEAYIKKVGNMSLIINVPEKIIKNELNKIDKTSQAINISVYNSKAQTLVSGTKEATKELGKRIRKKGGEFVPFSMIPMKVDAPFHSPLMKFVEHEIIQELESYTYYPLAWDVISNVTAKPYKSQNGIKKNLSLQITHPVKWWQTLFYMEKNGVDIALEIGPMYIMQQLVAENTEKIKTYSYDVEKDRKEFRKKIKIKNKIPYVKAKSKDKKDKIDKRYDLFKTKATSLGNDDFKQDYNIKYAYVIGGMQYGISSKELVIKASRAGFLSFYGTSGLEINEIIKSILYMQDKLNSNNTYGMNLVNNYRAGDLIDLFLQYKINNIEISGYMEITPEIAKFRLKGLKEDSNGNIVKTNKIIAKVTRPEIANKFLKPVPDSIVDYLNEKGEITEQEVKMAKTVSMADDICVVADSGASTDQGTLFTLLPAIIHIKNRTINEFKYAKDVRIGAAGGIGTPEAAIAAFILGADFILTGSINQCTVEAGTSSSVKNILEQIDVKDIDYAPEIEMFELGAKVQVIKRGSLFSIRANKLYNIFRQYNSFDEIDEDTNKNIQKNYFNRSFTDIFNEIKSNASNGIIEKAEKNSKFKMSLIIKWYLTNSFKSAINGNNENLINYQIFCGPALGAFNEWAKGTDIENWENRNIDIISKRMMHSAAVILNEKIYTNNHF